MKRILIICGVVLVLGIIILTCLFACGDKSGDKNTNTDNGKDTKTTSVDISTSTSGTTTPTAPTTTKLTALTTSPTQITTTTTTITTTPTTATTTPPTTTPPTTTATTPKPTPTQPPKTEPPATEPPVTPYNQMDSGNAYLDTVMKDWFNSRGYYVWGSDFMISSQRSIKYSSQNKSICIFYKSFGGESLTTDDTSTRIGIYAILVYNTGFGMAGGSQNILYDMSFDDLLEFQSNPDILLDYISPYF